MILSRRTAIVTLSLLFIAVSCLALIFYLANRPHSTSSDRAYLDYRPQNIALANRDEGYATQSSTVSPSSYEGGATTWQKGQTTTYYGDRNADKAVIVIHGGGYLIGSNRDTDSNARRLANSGYYVINLAYPLGDLLAARQALEESITEARRHQRYVYVYGQSAGGGLAALATATGMADGGFAYAPVSDLTSWKKYSESKGLINWGKFRDSSPYTLKRMSAINYASSQSSPLLIVHGRQDKTVPFEDSLRLQDRYPALSVIQVHANHAGDASGNRYAIEAALDCFAGHYPCLWAAAHGVEELPVQ